MWTTSALFIGILLWFIHGIVIGDLPVILANGVSLGLSALMLWLVVKYR
jgi:MtN3 and saliva related transmembrane protein